MLWFSLIFAIATGLVLFDDAIGITDEIKTKGSDFILWSLITNSGVEKFRGDVDMDSRRSINIQAPINSTSYGLVSLNILRQFAQTLSVDAALFPITKVHAQQSDAAMLTEAIERAKTFDIYAPSLRIWHQFSMAESVGKGKRYGYTVFEMDRFTPMEVHQMSSLDRIIVPSQWAKGVVESSIPAPAPPCFVAPLGVDTDIFKPMEMRGNKSNTIFLNMGKWEIRKGHDILIEAFNKAFKPSDNVLLYMMNYNQFLTDGEHAAWHDMYVNTPMGGHVRVLPWVNTQDDVAEIMNTADCGVFPSRAEGWNLEALEMMACGKHVIITDCSAHTEFCNKENALLIEIDEKEDAYDGKWFLGEGDVNVGQWASIGDDQMDMLVQYMRHIHETKRGGGLDTNRRGLETAKQFSWQNCAKSVLTAMED
jgi:glycosyltransferase involved in cell wall biosynthesis